MRTRLLFRIAALVALVAYHVNAEPFILYLTASTGTIQKSDDGLTWTAYVSGFGTQRLRGITTDNNGNVIFINRDGGTGDADRPVYAYTPAGTYITNTIADTTSLFNLTPLGYFKGYVYLSSGSGGGGEDKSSSWDGSVFGSYPFAVALASGWQANDMCFVTYDGTDYQFVNGTSGTLLRRRTVVGDGTLANQTYVTNIPSSGSLPDYFSDLAITPNRRLVLLGQGTGTTSSNGIWVSDAGVMPALNSVTVTLAFAFSATETPDTGNMGQNARDMVLVGTNIYAISNTRCYRYILNDDLGTVTYVTNALHGFNQANSQVAVFIVPEPLMAGVVALFGLAFIRRRKAF
ncbi:MAG: hypothetical protein N2595_02145 [bacterium]|nr:hypothetical protein [bacterium]